MIEDDRREVRSASDSLSKKKENIHKQTSTSTQISKPSISQNSAPQSSDSFDGDGGSSSGKMLIYAAACFLFGFFILSMF